MSRFKKGQIIYRASEWCIRQNADGQSKAGHYVYVVLDTVVDACGKKKVTFYDKDIHTFCRSCNADHPDLCATPEEAMARIQAILEFRKNNNEVIEKECPQYNAGATNSTFQIVQNIYKDNSVGYSQLREDLAYLKRKDHNTEDILSILRPCLILWYPDGCKPYGYRKYF